MRSIQQVKTASKDVFNRELKKQQRIRASVHKDSLPFKAAFDLPLITLTKRLEGIRKDFKKVAFVGPNPYLFLQHAPPNLSQIDKFFFVEQAEQSVQKSHDIITEKIDRGFFDRQGVELPEQMVPVVLDEETEWEERFKDENLDLIVSNMTLHWVNDLQKTFNAFHDTLVPDGVFIGSALGGDTLQELRICFNLAESERDGGVSPCVSPMLSMTGMGNVFARCKFTMPTIDVTRTTAEFTSAYALFDYLKMIGEQSAMHEGQRRKNDETFLAVASLMQTLFNVRTSPPDSQTSIHVDLLKDWYGQDDELRPTLQKQSETDNQEQTISRPPNIVSSFDLVHLIGWRYHEAQAQAKERGSAEFTLRDVVKDLNEQADDDQDKKVNYGVIIDDGDEIIEK